MRLTPARGPVVGRWTISDLQVADRAIHFLPLDLRRRAAKSVTARARLNGRCADFSVARLFTDTADRLDRLTRAGVTYDPMESLDNGGHA